VFGLGLTEIITLIIVIIILMNPKDLPLVVRRAGVLYGKIMRQINGIKKTFSDFEQEVRSISEVKSSGELISWKDNEGQTIKGEIK